MYKFTFDDNGLGKAYGFSPELCGLSTLPANLISFNGYVFDKQVQPTWHSESEQDLAYYELQRSPDGVRFTAISLVFANGAPVNTYDVPDRDPYPGANYYRLKMVDNDSKFTYSNIILARFTEKSTGTAVVAPNPVRNELNILVTGMEKGMYQLKLYNSAGVLMMTKDAAVTAYRQTITMPPVTHLKTGTYWLNMLDAAGKDTKEIKIIVLKD